MGDTTRAVQSLPKERLQKVMFPMFAIGTIGIAKGELIFECRYETVSAPRHRQPFAIGVTSKYFRGPQRHCPAYTYRSDGRLTMWSDDTEGIAFGPPLLPCSVITMHLNLAARRMAMYIDGKLLGDIFRFSLVPDPEPLFPVVVFGHEGDTCSIQAPTVNIRIKQDGQ